MYSLNFRNQGGGGFIYEEITTPLVLSFLTYLFIKFNINDKEMFCDETQIPSSSPRVYLLRY